MNGVNIKWGNWESPLPYSRYQRLLSYSEWEQANIFDRTRERYLKWLREHPPEKKERKAKPLAKRGAD